MFLQYYTARLQMAAVLSYTAQYVLPVLDPHYHDLCQLWTPVTELKSNLIIPLVRITHLDSLFSFWLQVQTTERSDWFECPEGVGLKSLLEDITTSNRCVFLLFKSLSVM